jgi:hypothetical protein
MLKVLRQSPTVETPTDNTAELSLAQSEVEVDKKERKPQKPDEVIMIPTKKVTKQLIFRFSYLINNFFFACFGFAFAYCKCIVVIRYLTVNYVN